MIISEEILRKKIKKALIEGTFGTISMGSGAQQSDEDEESGKKKDLKDFVEMKDVDIESARSSKVSGATGRESGIKVSKVFEIAEKTGMKPSGVYGFMTVESGGNASAMATNPHKISGEPSLYSTPFGITNHREITQKWKDKGIRMESYYNAHSNDDSKAILEKMESVSKLAATSVTAFGSMQVMGAFILPRFNNDPDALHASFKSDPEEFSVNALFDWVNHKDNKDFLSYVNKGDYKNAVTMYYGAHDEKYVSIASSAAARFEKHLEKHKKKSDGLSVDSWKGKENKIFAKGINFHKLKRGGPGNYRSGMKPKHVNATPEFFKQLKKDFGIDTVITLNADNGGQNASIAAASAGLNTMYAPASDGGGSLNMKNYTFEDIVAQLDRGNTLIHCTHGADRTGAVVGRYYARKGMSVADALKDAYKYKSGGKSSFMKGPTNYIKKG